MGAWKIKMLREKQIMEIRFIKFQREVRITYDDNYFELRVCDFGRLSLNNHM